MMVNTNQQVHSLLEVGGEFSLNVKRGAFSLDASGRYLKETRHRENAVEILIKHSYRTVINHDELKVYRKTIFLMPTSVKKNSTIN